MPANAVTHLFFFIVTGYQSSVKTKCKCLHMVLLVSAEKIIQNNTSKSSVIPRANQELDDEEEYQVSFESHDIGPK